MGCREISWRACGVLLCPWGWRAKWLPFKLPWNSLALPLHLLPLLKQVLTLATQALTHVASVQKGAHSCCHFMHRCARSWISSLCTHTEGN